MNDEDACDLDQIKSDTFDNDNLPLDSEILDELMAKYFMQPHLFRQNETPESFEDQKVETLHNHLRETFEELTTKD